MGSIISYLNIIDYKALEERFKPVIQEIVNTEIEKLKSELKVVDPSSSDASNALKAASIVVLDKIEQIVDECADNSCCN